MMRRKIRRKRRAQDNFTNEHVLMWESVVSRWKDWPERAIETGGSQAWLDVAGHPL